MNQLDRPGTFKFEVQEAGVGETKNGFPQWVSRLKAIAFFDETGELTGGEPGWVDWSSYDQQIVSYLVLFNDDGPLLNYEQLVTALEWDGTSFASLADPKHVGRTILGRVDWNEYNGKTNLRVEWVDDENASPNRSIRCLDSGELKGLDAKFRQFMNKTKPAPAKATPLPAAPAAAPAAAPKATAPKAAAPAPAAAPAAPAQAATTTAEQLQEGFDKAVAAEAQQAEAQDAPDNRDDVWSTLFANKGTATDDDLTKAYLEACANIGKAEDQFTAEDWTQVFIAATNALSGQ